MSGDHNQYQKDKSYLDGMDRYKQVRELVKDPSLRIKDIAELTGYNKGHVSRLRKASQQFECPRCGHCCQALEEKQEPLYWSVADGWVYGGNCYGDGTVYRGERSKDSETPTLKAGLIDEIHMTPSEKLHLQAAAYANRRKEAYLDHLKKGLAEKISRKMVDCIWVAHYEGYREAIQELKNHGH